MEDFSVPNDKITVFGLTYCPYCKGTQKFLDKRLIDFNYITVDGEDEETKNRYVAFIETVNPRKSFPTVLFGDTGEVVVGYDLKKLKDALDVMLAKYPEVQKPLPEKKRSLFSFF